jgi:hypothetical protein
MRQRRGRRTYGLRENETEKRKKKKNLGIEGK